MAEANATPEGMVGKMSSPVDISQSINAQADTSALETIPLVEEETPVDSSLPVPSSNETTQIVVPRSKVQTRAQTLNKIYQFPTPIRTFPLPLIAPTNPLSIILFLYAWLKQVVSPPSSYPQALYQGWYSPESRSVHVTDPKAIRALWEQGFYGKGTLSRSEPSWMDREKRKQGAALVQTAEEVTQKRRQARLALKWERARELNETIERTQQKEQGILGGEGDEGLHIRGGGLDEDHHDESNGHTLAYDSHYHVTDIKPEVLDLPTILPKPHAKGHFAPGHIPSPGHSRSNSKDLSSPKSPASQSHVKHHINKYSGLSNEEKRAKIIADVAKAKQEQAKVEAEKKHQESQAQGKVEKKDQLPAQPDEDSSLLASETKAPPLDGERGHDTNEGIDINTDVKEQQVTQPEMNSEVEAHSQSAKYQGNLNHIFFFLQESPSTTTAVGAEPATVKDTQYASGQTSRTQVENPNTFGAQVETERMFSQEERPTEPSFEATGGLASTIVVQESQSQPEPEREPESLSKTVNSPIIMDELEEEALQEEQPSEPAIESESGSKPESKPDHSAAEETIQDTGSERQKDDIKLNDQTIADNDDNIPIDVTKSDEQLEDVSTPSTSDDLEGKGVEQPTADADVVGISETTFENAPKQSGFQSNASAHADETENVVEADLELSDPTQNSQMTDDTTAMDEAKLPLTELETHALDRPASAVGDDDAVVKNAEDTSAERTKPHNESLHSLTDTKEVTVVPNPPFSEAGQDQTPYLFTSGQQSPLSAVDSLASSKHGLIDLPGSDRPFKTPRLENDISEESSPVTIIPSTREDALWESAAQVAAPRIAEGQAAFKDTTVELEDANQELTAPHIAIVEQEHLQLTLEESFFLAYGFGVLEVLDPKTQIQIPVKELFKLYRQPTPHLPVSPKPDDAFIISYVAYHHFRSLGWVVRGGIKFGVDYLLYNRGPPFSHAEFAISVMPAYTAPYWSSTTDLQAYVKGKTSKNWSWLHCMNRVNTQVKKTLVLVYVDIPEPLESEVEEKMDVSAVLRRYKVKEVVLKRWSANRNRD